MLKSTKFKYIANGDTETNPFIVRDIDPAVYYSLGENFDNFKFRRHRSFSYTADELLEKRIRQLRSKYQYLRVWFSGGKDSWLVIDTAIRFGVHIDEIVIVKKPCVNAPGLFKQFSPDREIDEAAIPYLESVKDKLAKTKISILYLDDIHHEVIFEDPAWCTHTCEWFFSQVYTTNFFYRYINPKFNLLENIKDSCDIFGATSPIVKFNSEINKWQFHLYDASFQPFHGNSNDNSEFEDFLFTENFPEIADLYVNNIADKLEFDYLDEHREILSPYETLRHVREHSKFYDRTRFYQGFQHSKVVPTDIKCPDNHYHWNLSQNPKSINIKFNRYFQNPQPLCWKYYLKNTAWKQIEEFRNLGLIKTKVWTLS